jgi:hypothetical protein
MVIFSKPSRLTAKTAATTDTENADVHPASTSAE